MKDYVAKTIEYYDHNCDIYRTTWDDEFLDNYNFDVPDLFLSYLKPGACILDLGCGFGRDSRYFKSKGYQVKAVDGSKEMCKIAAKTLGEPVEQINFFDIEYVNRFDGIFACASLLHLNDEDLKICLKKLVLALKEHGVLCASFKRGEGERIKDGRYFNDMTEEKFREICRCIPEMKIVKAWKNPQYGDHIPFINFVLEK